MNWHQMTVSEAGTALRKKELSAVELTKLFLQRIDSFERQIGAYVTIDTDGALRQAEAADRRLQSGETSPLLGIPLAHKDIFCTSGLRTTCSSRMLQNFVPAYDATVTQRLRSAGAVILGKTNMDEFAMGSSTETSFFGVTRNPWNRSCIPGGSSGGSAAAVAARLCLAATGTDTGGSIRQPAAMTGITGLKPTYGRVSRFGMIAFASSLDQAGPMTATVEDAAILLQTMAGFDPADATSIDSPVPCYTELLHGDVRRLRVGLPKEYFGEGLSPSIRAALTDALQVFRDLGVELVEISLPHTHYAIPTYYILASAEASSNLARYDGVKYGYRCEQPVDLRDMYCRSRAEGFGAEVKRRIMLGTYVLSSGYYEAYYRKAQKARRLIADDFRTAFESVDLLLTPTTPGTAFQLGERLEDPVTMYLSDIFTINVNLAGLPGISIPCGFDAGRLPIGLQLIAKPFDETTLLRLGYAFQQATHWHRCHPNDPVGD